MNKKIKKFLFLTSAIFFILIIFQNPTKAIQSGNIIKAENSPSVYFLGENDKRYSFPNEQTFFSWYQNFDSLTTVSIKEMASYRLAGNITIRPGTKLIKITTDPKVYAIETGGELRWIESEGIAKTLYGNDWAKKIVDVPDTFINDYKINNKPYNNTTGSDVVATKLSANEYPNGSLIKYANSDEIYLISDEKKRKIETNAFNANHFRTENIIIAPMSISHANGLEIKTQENDIINLAKKSTTASYTNNSVSNATPTTPSSGGGGGGGSSPAPTNTPTDACQENSGCDDSDVSTTDTCSGSPKTCSNTAITECLNDDNYCPDGCSNANDNNCEVSYATNNTYDVPVLVLSYFPTTPCYSVSSEDEIDLSGATASSNRASSNPQNAIDGSVTSGKWSFASAPYQDQYLLVDLGGLQSVGAISFYYWATDRPESYHVDVSATGLFVGEEVRIVTETDGLSGYIASEEHGSIMKKNYIFEAVNAQYIRLTVDDYRNNQSPDVGQLNLYELKIYSGSEQKNCLDQDVTGDIPNADSTFSMADPLSEIRSNVNTGTTNLMTIMQDGSKYKNVSSSVLNYQIYEQNEYLFQLPLQSTCYKCPDTSGIYWYRPDYKKLLSGNNCQTSEDSQGFTYDCSNSIDICDYVDNQGVKEVWLWGYHYGTTEPAESNMSMGTDSQTYWNHATYGDVSNSEGTDDLPICENTYTLYNYNYARIDTVGIGSVHNQMHQWESVFGWLNSSMFNRAGGDKFVGPYSNYSSSNTEETYYRCGWGHFPPNGDNYPWGYNYSNANYVWTDCLDWKPDGSGEKSRINCDAWGCTESGFNTMWMQSIPGKGNDLESEGNKLKNWWDFMGDFDAAIAVGKDLLYEQ